MFQHEILQHVIQSLSVMFSCTMELFFVQKCFDPLVGRCSPPCGHSVVLKARDWSVGDRKENSIKDGEIIPPTFNWDDSQVYSKSPPCHAWQFSSVKAESQSVSLSRVFPHEALRCTKIQMQLNPWNWPKLPVDDCAQTTNTLIIKPHAEPADEACWGLSEELSWLPCRLPGHMEPEGPVWCWFHGSKHEAVRGGLYQRLSPPLIPSAPPAP